MAFKYKTIRNQQRKPPRFGDIYHPPTGEGLTGLINGWKASDIEERFARALDNNPRVTGYSFREAVISSRNLPGQLEVDFVVQTGPVIHPIQVDGEYAHKGISKHTSDAGKDALVNEYYKPYGAMPVIRIDGAKLFNQDAADFLVKGLL